MRKGAFIGPLALLLAACTEHRAEPPASEPSRNERPAAVAPPPPAAPAPTPPAPSVEPAPPVDELSQPELEAACFRGRQEACDRLGAD